MASSSWHLRGRREASVDGVEHSGYHKQDQAESTCQPPVGGAGRVECNDGTDHLIVRSAEQCRSDVVADGDHEDEERSREKAWQTQGEQHAPEGPNRPRPHRLRSRHEVTRDTKDYA